MSTDNMLRLNLKPTDPEIIPNNLYEPLLTRQPSNTLSLERKISTNYNQTMNLSITNRRKDHISLGMNATVEIIPAEGVATSPDGGGPSLHVPGAANTMLMPEDSQFGKNLMDSMMQPPTPMLKRNSSITNPNNISISKVAIIDRRSFI